MSNIFDLFKKIEKKEDPTPLSYIVAGLGNPGDEYKLTRHNIGFLAIDYIAEKQYPLLFVTSGKLGSINHTLLSLEAIKNRGIRLDTVLYNLYPTVEDKTIQEDTMQYIKNYLAKHFPDTKFEVVPEI